jgi:EAL domain-containing protein (putative c-di-GMP-specific phosphodiesterase class I)
VTLYQPLVSLDGNHIIGFEALARWESKSLGPIPPVEFIPIAEETGLIITLGDQLFRRACLDAKTWPADGTGYATLSQLLSFHLDKIKIDRSFVSRLGKSEDSQVIIRAILGLAKGFGLATPAEGVEDESQLACLKANGCADGQGYLFGKAIPAADIPALLGRSAIDSAAA